MILPQTITNIILQPERLLFQNEACFVINKLPGESSEFPQPEKDGSGVPVHRLDQPVSGCLLLAKTPEAAAFLGAAFAHSSEVNSSGGGRVEKRYWAIIEKPEKEIPSEAELVHWLNFNTKTNKSFANEGAGRGRKKAVMRYRIAGAGERYLFLEIELVTGRHHQIRAQLAALGLHVKGDLKYGARRSEKGGGIRLHAYSLAFPNPLKTDEAIEVKALPHVMDALWTACAEALESVEN